MLEIVNLRKTFFHGTPNEKKKLFKASICV